MKLLKSASYEWQGNWGDVPASKAHAHHGITVMADGNILTGHIEDPVCIVLTPAGKRIRQFKVPTAGTHCLTVAVEKGQEVLWITDVVDPQIVKTDLEGRILNRLTRADFPLGDDDAFCPTATALDPETGEVWIADGYGSNTVHCFSSELNHKFQLDGEKGLGSFLCPHWVFVDRRNGSSRIYVADRGRDRVQVFHPDGTFSHGIEQGLVTPSVFDTFGDYLVVGELKARVHILDGKDQIVMTLGDGHHHCEKPGWPNREDGHGKAIPPQDDIPDGEFNSPHGMCADAAGNIYVSEWLLGDRYTKLVRKEG